MCDSRGSSQNTFHYYDEEDKYGTGRTPTSFGISHPGKLAELYWSNTSACIYVTLADVCRPQFPDVVCVTDFYSEHHQLTVYLEPSRSRIQRLEEIAVFLHKYVIKYCLQYRVPKLFTCVHHHLEDRLFSAQAMIAYTQKYGSTEASRLLEHFPEVFQQLSLLSAGKHTPCSSHIDSGF